VVALFNFTPVPRNNYRIGVPLEGFYREAINSDAQFYGGGNVGNQGGVHSEAVSWMGRPYSIPINVPPLGGLVLVFEPPQGAGEQESAVDDTIEEDLDADAE
jgi:1,4-alpha-glucan branching enzyme